MVTNIAGILANAKGAMTGGYSLNKASAKEMVEQRFGIASQTAEFMALAASGVEPDVLLGFFPIYLVTDLEAGKSSKSLRFRGIGGHLLAFNKGEGNTLIIKFSLVGPLAPLYLQLLDMTYYYGAEKAKTRPIDLAGLVGGVAMPGTDVVTMSNNSQCLRFGQISDQGARGTFNNQMNTGGSQILPNDIETTKVADPSVDMNEMEISDRNIQEYDVGDAHSSNIAIDTNDWEIIASRRTFNVITKNEIYTRMYIETMLHAERKDMALGEIEVDLLLRKFVDPPPKTRYILQEAGIKEVAVDKRAINDASNGLSKEEKKKFKSEGSNVLKNSYMKKTPLERMSIDMDIGSAQATLASMEKPRTKYTAGAGTTKWKQITGIQSCDIVDQGAVSMMFNLGWRAVGIATRLIFMPAPFAMDPMIGRLAAASDYTKANSRAGEKEVAGSSTLLSIAAHVVEPDDDSVPIAPHQSPSINNGSASSTTYQQGVTFVTDPTLVSVTLNGKTGVTEYNTPIVAWKDFLDFLGEDNTVDDIIDVLACTPTLKQADMESTISNGCNLYKLSGAIPHDGSLAFSVPVGCSLRMEIQQNLGAEQFTPKMNAAGSEFTVQPGLVYFLGTGAVPSWALDPDDGMVHVNKSVLDEIYFYCKNIVLAGDHFMLTGFFFYPMLGV